jgi:hypothetical protein
MRTKPKLTPKLQRERLDEKEVAEARARVRNWFRTQVEAAIAPAMKGGEEDGLSNLRSDIGNAVLQQWVDRRAEEGEKPGSHRVLQRSEEQTGQATARITAKTRPKPRAT